MDVKIAAGSKGRLEVGHTPSRDRSTADVLCPQDAVLPFPGTACATVAQAGGKGESLIRLASAGLPVPRGFVLASGFFQPWIDAVAVSSHWECLLTALPAQWGPLCEALKQQALTLPIDGAQQATLDALDEHLAAFRHGELFAVRSSSPQEDLHGASFAGGYETYLGVRAEGLLSAVRGCFASAFNERVIAYKTSHGLDVRSPSMAVIIQTQIDSEVAGVAFSLNPLNNDLDQAVINASWGQGETVVAGHVTPDHWVLDKLTGRVLEANIPDKHLSRWLQPDGTLLDRQDYRRSEPSLAPGQLDDVLAITRRVEALYAHPVDIEWAFESGRLHILQARPVTAFVPLPPEMLTLPGARRRLYLDIALSSGLTINAPISPAGLDVFRRLASDLARLALGGDGCLPRNDDALVLFSGARMYLDLSNAMWLGGPRLLAKKMRMGDALVADTLEQVDPSQYRSLRRPAWARLRNVARMPVIWWRLRHLIANCLLPFLAPRTMHGRITQQLAAYERDLAAQPDFSLPLDAFWSRHVTSRLQTLLDVSMAVVGPGVGAVQAFAFLARRILGEDAQLRGKLDRGFGGNVVVDMSLEMSRLATLLPAGTGAAGLERRIAAGECSTAFLEGWARFLDRFGDRGPLEMDIAQPRYGDAPGLALTQITAMCGSRSGLDLDAAVRCRIDARRQATADVIAQAGPLRRWLLQRLSTVVELFAGMRDTPKHHLLAILHSLRRRLVLEGERLCASGRLDEVNDVFDLGIDDLLAGERDCGLDLRRLRADRRGFYERLETQIINFPSMIDSRGRVLRPPARPRQEDECQGIALSPGVVTGRARTLRSPHEKRLERGEILIAYTTDPGWTPLFTNAAAVVLEIGGTLQHGAVVARELGLPCVAGVEGISRSIPDGQMIEVDGHRGTVRLVTPATLDTDSRDSGNP